MSSAAEPRYATDASQQSQSNAPDGLIDLARDGETLERQESKPALFGGLKLSRDLILLWLGQFVSQIGDWCLWVAIPITIYNATNSKKALAFSVVTEGLPYLIFSPIAGVIVDRTNRRTTMIVTDLVRAALVALLAIPFVHPIPLWGYYTVLFFTAAASAFFMPARMVILTQVVPQRQLMRVNTLLDASWQISDVVGPPLGGLLIAVLTKRGAFLADTATFLLSAIFIRFLTVGAIPSARNSKLSVENVVADIKVGFAFIRRSRILKGLLVSWNVGYIAIALFATMLYAFCRDRLHLSAEQYGFMLSFVGAGYLTGGLLIATVLHKKEPVHLVAEGLLLSTVSALIFAYTRGLTLACASMFIFGFSTMLHSVPTQTLVQTLVEQDMLGRFSSAFSVAARLAQIFGAMLAAALALYSLQSIYFAAAAGFVFSAALAAYLLPKSSNTNSA